MPGARISFTCNTDYDRDVIEWLDSFSSRERGIAIISAIRHFLNPSTDEEGSDFSVLEEKLSEIFSQVVALRKHQEQLVINNNLEYNNNLTAEEGEVDPKVNANIGKLFED